jgi:glycosyltransferase involved in cell wall biosynthesis
MRGTIGRVAAQNFTLTRVEGQVCPDITISFNPIIPFSPSHHHPFRVLLLGDLRHLSRPGEFSRMQLVYRHVLWRRGLRRADLIFAISHSTAKELIDPDLRAKVVVIHPGVDHVDPWRVGCSSAASEPYVLHLAHRSNKGTLVALDAWRLVLENCALPSGPHFMIVGTRPSGIDVPDRTTFVPPLPQPDFECLMSQASCLLFTSEYEGYGMPVGEAARLGIPVVTSAVPVAVETEVDVRVVHPGDAAMFASALCQVLREPPSAETIAASARNLTWDAAARRLRRAVLERLVLA